MQDFLAQVPAFSDLALVLTNGNSDYWCVFVRGPLHGRVCYLGHDEPDIAPCYRRLAHLVDALNVCPDACELYDIDRTQMDFPARVEDDADQQALVQLYQQLEKAQQVNDETSQQQVAYCIMALTPLTQLEALYVFVQSDDMFIEERAITLLKVHQYAPARDLLMRMASEALPNGRQAALKALGLIRQAERKM